MEKCSGFTAATVSLTAFCGVFAVSANDAPEYLKVRSPIVDTLEDVPSTTANLGITPESWIERRERRFASRPGVLLPGLRDRHVPRTGVNFVDDAAVSVRPRFYHRYRDYGDGEIAEATAGGGALAFESGWLRDTLRISLAGFTSQKLYGPEDRDGTGLLRDGQESYTVLGEAFGEIRIGEDTSFFGGRTPVDLPYINANDSRMTPNTFRAIGVRTTAISNLQIGGGHIDRIKLRNSSVFEPMSESAGAPGTDEGVSVIGIRYNIDEDFYVGVIDQYGWDMFNTLYLESNRLHQLTGDLELRVGGQFTDQRSIGDAILGDIGTRAAGVKAALGFRGLIASASYTWTADDGGIQKPWGGSPSFNSVMISDFDRAGEKAVRAGVSYDLSRLGVEGLAASAVWLHGTTPDTGANASPDQREFNVTVDYRPPIEFLENFWFRVRYAVNERDSIDDRDFRVILNYAYSF